MTDFLAFVGFIVLVVLAWSVLTDGR